ncbi:MAG: hypothetical protein RLZ12_577, partial [Bacillota bacterium]
VIGEHLTLIKKGENYWGLCPFHTEKTPSFLVSEKKQLFYCFGCHIGGDVISFVREIYKLSFNEALDYLNEHSDIAEDTGSPLGVSARGEQLAMLEAVSQFYRYNLIKTKPGVAAVTYLESRGVLQKSRADFGIGYALPGRQSLYNFLSLRGFNLVVAEQLGLLRKINRGYEDVFFDRIIFPLHDIHGKVLGFGARSLAEGSSVKYINSSSSELFSKSKYLYGLNLTKNEIQKQKEVLVVEGYLDVISLWEAGIKNTVAQLGTALTEGQVKLIKRFAKNVVLCYDADLAGYNALPSSTKQLYRFGVAARVVSLPAGQDPDLYLRQAGRKAFLHCVTEALSYIELGIREEKRAHRLDTVQGKSNCALKCLEIIAACSSAIEADYYLQQLSEDLSVSLSFLREEYLNQKRRAAKISNRTRINKKAENGHTVDVVSALEKAEQHLLAYMMRDATLVLSIMEAIGDRFTLEKHLVLAAHLYEYAYHPEEFKLDKLMQIDGIDRSLLARLSLLDLPEKLTKQAFDDYVQRINMATLSNELFDKRNELKRAAETEPLLAARLSVEIHDLSKKMV